MKKVVLFLLVACMLLSVLTGLISCNDSSIQTLQTEQTSQAPQTSQTEQAPQAYQTEPNTPQLQKLSAPVVSLTGNIASWAADPNADKFEVSLDGNLSYVENTVTSKSLTDGQTFKLRAVGNGSTYSTSDWSNSVTYTASTPAPQPTKLGTPIVTISNTGLASWTAVANASSYVYKINSGAEAPTTATSLQLTDGQSIVVKAVGDGTNYTDSDYSASRTYTANTPTPTGVPSYLGIFASNSQPSSADGLPKAFSTAAMTSYRVSSPAMMSATNYRSFGSALDEYFADSNNHFDTDFPEKSEYEIYSASGEIIYIQIWLNNPSQHTILSLKLNGTKYQVGGGLSSFFVEEGGEHFNCVYVAVTVPSSAHTEITYTVSDIEYIADTYINADGTDEFMNNNDTVFVGLPYNAQHPTVSDFTTSLTMNSCSATLNVADASELIDLSGGWIGIAVYDGYDIIFNQRAVIGNNSVSSTGLLENTDYWVYVYLYADLHDGNGVSAHILFEQRIGTSEAISKGDISGTLLYDSSNDGYYGAIKVNTTLNSNTAEYIKLEILKDDEVVYTDTSYNGTDTVSEGILCGNSYTVRVYYKDTEYPEGKYIEESAWVRFLGTPWYQEAGTYTFVNDAVYYFQLSNGDENYPAIDSFTLKLYKEESARWVANDVLYILEHPTAIDDLNAQIDVLFAQMNELPRGEEMDAVYNQIQELRAILAPLEDAKWYLENRANNNTDIAYWQAEAAKGKYYYEFEYNGTDTEKVFKVGKYYYVVLDDALTYGLNGLDIEIEYKYDKQEGGALTEGTVNEGINLDRALTNHWVEMENVSYADGKLTLTLFNERDYWTGIGAPYAIGYVYKVEVDNKVLYIDESKHEFDIDETAWFNEYIQLIKAGQSVDGLMEKYVSDYESSYTIPVDATKLEAGNRNFAVSIRLIGTDYEDGECQAKRLAYDIAVYAQIEKPTIEYKELYGEYYGVVTPESLDGWNNDHYEYEAIDENGNPVDITIASEAGYARFYVPSAGTKVRVKIPASGYWLESEWSEWVTFDGIKVSAPTFGEYDKDTCEISWSADTANVSHYLYTINGGTLVKVELDGDLSVALDNGDVLRVMCVASEEGLANGYLDSEWVEYICTDARHKLNTPANIRFEDGSLVWDAVTGASMYIVEQNYSGMTRAYETYYERWSAKIGATYRVRVIPADAENYKISNWSDTYVFTVTLANPEFMEVRRERVYWNGVDYAQGYNYKIGEDGEVNTTRNYYLALSEIPTGEKLYVQAYAEGCTSSEWVMIYHNVTKLATPEVTVSGGTASWSAVENAEGYLYKINGGEERATTELSVSGLNAGDTITVCATTDEFGYGNSDWSEIKAQLPIMSAPVLDTSLFSSEGTVSWSAVEGATAYEYDLDGVVNTSWEMCVTDIQFGQSFKIRAICDNGEYEQYGEWTEIVVREDTREQLATPIIDYDPEIGLTVAINDPKVSHYEVMFGQDGYKMLYYPPDGAYETEVITNSFAFPENDYTVYVKAVPNDGSYRDSEWATLTITFE